jgi:hypothetical protein
MRPLNENEQLVIKRKIFHALDCTVGGEQLVGHLASMFVSSKRFLEVVRMISGEMVMRGELEVCGRTEDGQKVVRRRQP